MGATLVRIEARRHYTALSRYRHRGAISNQSRCLEGLRVLTLNNQPGDHNSAPVAELVDHYTENELPNKTPYTREVYGGYISKWISPKWGICSLSDVRTVAVESWLGTLKLSNGSRAKVRNILSAIYAHAMRWEFFDKSPITLVRQSAKRQRTPEVLTVDELNALLAELSGNGAYWVIFYVAVTT